MQRMPDSFDKNVYTFGTYIWFRFYDNVKKSSDTDFVSEIVKILNTADML